MCIIGHNEKGTEVLQYKNLDLYDSDVIGEKTHIYIPLDDLDWAVHGNHRYYASIKAENSAGLSSTITSSPYHHIVRLPSKGIVLDVLSEDNAHQTGQNIQFGVSSSFATHITRLDQLPYWHFLFFFLAVYFQKL